MVKLGMLIADRYEIIEKVGNGGMSDVYKAKDHKLNRFVAVKVLKQEFSENANFVSKFRVEAQAAAGLTHPNIVNVYDVGEEKGVYFIIMELVDGITLKKYIESRTRLPANEALSIAIQVTMGLEAAHRNHIIHRDIKPQNIIISKDGKVKVTDFGIAKIATSNTITANVMGSVHYTSPEQARGGYSDEKSDIYSLGITLFEMVTGQVPYTGDTTVAIAIKHIQDPMPSPRDFVPDLPYSVEQIILKCCEKSPERRYQNTAELMSDLRRSIKDPDGSFVKRVNPEDLGATRPMTEEERKTIAAAAAAETAEAVAETPVSGAETVRGGHGGGSFVPDDDDYDEEEEEKDSRTERMTSIISIAAAIIVGIIIIVIAADRLGWIHLMGQTQEQAAMTVMPEVIGKTEEVARELVTSRSLVPRVELQITDEFDPGLVIGSSVEEGSEVEVGTTVILTVSADEGVEVPDVLGKTREEAEEILTEAGFEVTVTEAASEKIEEGCVISQTPEPAVLAEHGSTVAITVSTGPDLEGKVQMIDLTGLSEEAARSMLSQMGLTVGTVRTVITMNNSEIGKVIGQSVLKSTYVDEGTAVDLTIGGQMTYSYTARIDKPSTADGSQGGDYEDGTAVHIVVRTNSGQVLLDTTTSSFPYQGSQYTGITDSSGIVTMTWDYTYEKEETVVLEETDDDQAGDNGEDVIDETVIEEGGDAEEQPAEPQPEPEPRTTTRTVRITEPRTITREISFTAEY